MNEKIIVLYADDNNIWCPLRSLYWSHASKVCIARHPLSSIEEIISHYCPQCCTRYTEEETTTHCGKCPSCYKCPRCLSILSILSRGPSSSALLCGMCNWISRDYPVKDSDKMELSNEIKKDMIGSSSSSSNGDNNSSNENTIVFHDMLKKLKHTYETTSEQKKRNISLGTLSSSSSLLLSPSSSTSTSINDLKSVHQETGINLKTSNDLLITYRLESNLSLPTVHQMVLQNYPDMVDIDLAKPLHIELRAKKMIRCRKDFEQSKMNILIQPKASPLEGDSSMRIQRGKWWMKDASAIHEVPTVTILDYPKEIRTESFYISMMISNPKEVAMECQLYFPDLSSMGPMEPFYVMSDISSSSSSSGSNSSTLPYVANNYSHIILDSYDNHQSMNKIQSIPIVLGPYEDELLRDDDDDENDDDSNSKNKNEDKKDVLLSSEASASSTSISNDNIDQTHNAQSKLKIEVSCRNHMCFVTIPVKVLDLSVSMASLEVLLQVTKVGDELLDQNPIRIKICLSIQKY